MTLYLNKLENGETLSQFEMAQAMGQIMDGMAEDESIETFLTILAERGETSDEITGAAKVLRDKAKGLSAPAGAIDCCGTGGDRKGTYNISTAVAIVSAACGVPIAKHGNRASSSKSGAADVLEAMGVNLDAPQSILEHALHTLNFAFLMAPNHHQAMKHVAAVRKKIKTRTIFNLLGPLANPAGTQKQLIGVYDQNFLVRMAETLRNLGTHSAWLVTGADGLDEMTTTAETYAVHLDRNGSIAEKVYTPTDFGVPYSSSEALIGGTAEHNAEALQLLLEGHKSAYSDIVLMNPAAVLCLHSSSMALKDAVKKAAEIIDTGKALNIIQHYIRITNT